MSATSPFPGRPEGDRCPGVLRLTEAADGFLARVRLPGGLISADQLRLLGRLAGALGDGRIELTSRGNVQLRGLAPTAATALTSELAAAGLLPSLTHDRVRNVLASPLAGLDGGPDLTEIVRSLDAGLCARSRLAELSGRFLFAIDDGRGDLAGVGADVVATIRPEGATVNGLAVPASDVAASMLGFAEAFLDLRAELGSTAWRIADLPAGADRVRAAVAVSLGWPAALPDERAAGANLGAARVAPPGSCGTAPDDQPAAANLGTARAGRPVGLIASGEAASGNSVVLLAPVGRLTAAQLTWVAARLAGREARITPWRSVVLPHLRDAAAILSDAASLGFGTDAASPWLRVTACAGRPGCASALADVQADAAAFAARWPRRLVHVSGCARHCGRPAATEIDVTATSEGYHVAGV